MFLFGFLVILEIILVNVSGWNETVTDNEYDDPLSVDVDFLSKRAIHSIN